MTVRIPKPPLFLRRCIALPLIILETVLVVTLLVLKLVAVFIINGPVGIINVFKPKSAAHIRAREAYSEAETKHLQSLWDADE